MIASYSNVLRGEFQFDDYVFVSGNPRITDLANFFPCTILKTLNSGDRPVTLFTYALNYAVGGLAVEGYHIANLLIHLLTVVLVFVFMRQTLALPPLAEAFGGGRDLRALAVSAVFALHPLQTESVSYIMQRSEALASFFYLLTLICLIAFVRSGKKGSGLALYAAGIACFALGWGSKEIIATAPLMLPIYAVFFLGKKEIRKSLLAAAPFLVAALWFGTREVAGFGGSSQAGFHIQGMGQPEYFYTQMRVLLTYLRLIILPVRQNLDYDYPVYRSFFAAPVLLSALFWAAAVCLSFSTLMQKGGWRWHLRAAGFGLIWFLLLLSPTSSLVPFKDVIYEHRCYLPLLGILISAMAVADMAYKKLRSSNIFRGRENPAFVPVALVLALLGVLAFATYGRNEVWKTKLSLWTDVVSKSPGKSRAHNNLGNCYLLMGDNGQALARYLTAMRLDRGNVETYYNAAITLERLDRRGESAFYYSKFLEKAPPEYGGIMQSVKEKLTELNRRNE